MTAREMKATILKRSRTRCEACYRATATHVCKLRGEAPWPLCRACATTHARCGHPVMEMSR